MNRFGILFLMAILWPTILWVQTKDELSLDNQELYFDKLLKMQLSEAELIAARLSENEKKYALYLINAIKGEAKLEALSIINNRDHERTDVLRNLSIGFLNNTVEKQNTIKVFQSFSKAISKANTYNQNNALKFSLISMLNLLRKQAFFGDEKFAPYLNHYKEIASGKNDERLILLLSIGLNSNENDEMKSKFQGFEVIKKLDELFSDMDNSALKTRYFFETAVQYKLVKDFKKSMFLMQKANFHSRNQPMNRDIYESSTWHISTLHYLDRKMDSAYFYWKKSASLSKRLRNQWYNERLASWIYKETGKMDSAYFYLDKSIRTEIKLDGKRQRTQASLLAIENQTEKLKLDKLQLDNRRKTNQNYLILAISLLLIGGLTALFLQKNTTKKRQLAEQEALLKQERVDNLLKEQELVSIDAMIAGQEKERQRVANELHDDLGSLMATIKLHFDNSKVSKKDPALQNAQKLLEEAYQKVRSMAHSKNSGVMSDQGLLPAIKKMAQVITDTNALEVVVEAFGMGDRLENSLELNLFRMVQELVANTIKHAEASKVSIQLTQHEDNLNIIIEDNGKGFDRSKVDTSKTGMGLTTIEKRVEHLEGNFTVDSVLGNGTSILIDIPV